MRKILVSLVLLMALLPGLARAEMSVVDQYASYSVNVQTGAWGFAFGQRSANYADNASMDGCGRYGCRVILTRSVNCIALASATTGVPRKFSAGAGQSKREAERQASARCTAPTCRVIHSACTR